MFEPNTDIEHTIEAPVPDQTEEAPLPSLLINTDQIQLAAFFPCFQPGVTDQHGTRRWSKPHSRKIRGLGAEPSAK